MIRGFGLRDDDASEVSADTCRGALAVEEARAFFGGADLGSDGNTAEWVGYQTEYCSAWARGQESSGVRLSLDVRPAAAHVLAEARQDIEELSDAQVLQVARFATESARRAAQRFGCEGPLGQRPPTVDRTPWQTRPAAQARGTCRGVVSSQDAARLQIVTVSEKPDGRALTEECALNMPAEGHHIRLNAYYGPSAQHEMYLDGRYPGSVKGAVTQSHDCKGSLGTAYFKFEEFPKPEAEKGARSSAGSEDAHRLLTAFASASGSRHGCPLA
ncbi:hypothetical protein [Streptomyces fradiae]|uniref:hypothetical protein n=1 Tax=Streptomyces fradiae TaxID=1906 RepID=UPI0035163104